MWLKSVKLENIKCFENIDLVFTPNPGSRSKARPYRWITLLGENGVGKSTVLQAIGLLLAGPEAAKELLPRPTGWVRDPSKPGKLTARIHKDPDDAGIYGGKERIRKNFSYAYYVTGGQSVQVPLKGRKRQKEETYTEPVLVEESSNLLSWLRVNAFASGNPGWFAAGYGPFRRLTRTSQILIPSLDTPTRASNFITQFNEDRALNTFERWMVYLEFRRAKDPNDQEAQKMWSVGEQTITALLPGDVQIDQVTKTGLINFLIDGQIVPTINLSDGYRSVISLVGDLIWRLLLTFPNMDDPTQASGIVLIDELDIHLHPTWQRFIADWLQNVFPRLQFIVATHSPFVAIGAGEGALTLRFVKDGDGAFAVQQVDDISAYDADRVLKSPAFNLVSTYSPQIQKKIERYHQLRLRLPGLDSEEKVLLEELTHLMQKIQFLNERPEPGSLLDRIDRFLEENLP
jgi:energy-coupling factor transporter ATP-binding protein EcfA2